MMKNGKISKTKETRENRTCFFNQFCNFSCAYTGLASHVGLGQYKQDSSKNSRDITVSPLNERYIWQNALGNYHER